MLLTAVCGLLLAIYGVFAGRGRRAGRRGVFERRGEPQGGMLVERGEGEGVNATGRLAGVGSHEHSQHGAAIAGKGGDTEDPRRASEHKEKSEARERGDEASGRAMREGGAEEEHGEEGGLPREPGGLAARERLKRMEGEIKVQGEAEELKGDDEGKGQVEVGVGGKGEGVGVAAASQTGGAGGAGAVLERVDNGGGGGGGGRNKERAAGGKYVVEGGDTLMSIAAKHHVPWSRRPCPIPPSSLSSDPG